MLGNEVLWAQYLFFCDFDLDFEHIGRIIFQYTHRKGDYSHDHGQCREDVALDCATVLVNMFKHYITLYPNTFMLRRLQTCNYV